MIEGPTESGQTVSIRGSATYRADGVPDLVLVLDEFVTFDGDRIVHLEDRYDDPMKQEIADYLEAHGDSLGIARDAGVVS